MRRVVPVVVLTTVLGLLTVPAQAGPPPLPADATLVVPGHGWGHGRGLGQWGANGMAQSGKTYTQILTHYYAGVAFYTRPAESIRVLVQEQPAAIVTSDDVFTASWSNGTAAATSSAMYPFFRARWDGSVYRLEKSGAYTGPWTLVATSSRWVVFTRGSKFLQVVSATGPVHYYRGSIIARLHSTGKMMAINELSLDEYLYGVVPREMPSSWPAEALKAQATAARTYAVYKKDYARSKGHPYDICATTSCQAYLGYASKPSPSGARTDLERSSTNAAVTATTRKVLNYAGKPILAEYSSSTGGYTAPGNVAYQKAVADPGDSVSPHHNWKARIPVADVERKFAIGRLVDVIVTKRNGYGEWGGRVLEMKLVGTSATKTISGHAWRSAFAWPTRSNGVRSNWFRVLFWRGELAATPAPVSVAAGDTGTMIAYIRNTGNVSWPVGGPVRLSTAPGSRFASGSWLSPTRPASVSRNVTTGSNAAIGRNQVAEFRVPISTAGVAPGSYTETFTLVADGYTTMTPRFTVPIQVVPGWRDDVFNVVENSSFEAGSLTPWSGSGLTSGDGRTTAAHREGSASLRLVGGGSKSVSQTIRFAGGQARRFVLGGWNRADGSSSAGGPIDLTATMVYADGSSSSATVPFARGQHAWRYGETAFASNGSKPLARIVLRARYSNQKGRGYFDAIRLVETPIHNASFENGLAGWTGIGLDPGDGSAAQTTRDGSRALTFASGLTHVVQTIPLTGRPTERFVFSSWNAASGVAANGDVSVTLEFVASDGRRSPARLTFPTADHAWTRREVVASAPFAFSKAVVTITLNSWSGSASFDAIQVSRSWTHDPSFEGQLASWKPIGFGSDDGVLSAPVREGNYALRLAGGGRQSASQSVAKSGGAGGRLLVSAWNRLWKTSTNGGLVALVVGFRNVDGSTSWVRVPFSETPHGWRYTEGLVVAPKRYSRIDIYVTFYDQTGGAAFDGVTLRSL